MKRNLLKTMLVAVGMVAGMSGAWAQEEITLLSTESAYVVATEPDGNHNGNEEEYLISYNTQYRDWGSSDGTVKFNTGGAAVFYKFDLSSLKEKSGILSNVTFLFTITGTGDGKNSYNIRTLGYNGEWDAETLTYSNISNNAGSITGFVTSTGSFQPLNTNTAFSTGTIFPISCEATASDYVKSAIEENKDYVTIAITTNLGRQVKLSTSATIKLTYTTAAQTSYTVKFQTENGETIKDDVINKSIFVGDEFNATSYVEDIFIGDKKYVYVSGNETKIADADASKNIIILVFKDVASYSYVVNAVDALENHLVELARGKGFEGETHRAFYTKAFELEGKWYMTSGNPSYPTYAEDFSTEDVKNVVYEEANIEYFSEVEALNVSRSWAANGAVPERYSNGDAVRLYANSFAYTKPLVGGVYSVTLWARNQSSTQTANLSLYVRDIEGNMTALDVSFENWTTSQYTTKTVENVIIPSGCSLVLNNATNYNSNLELDYIYLVKTAESVSVGDAGLATFCSNYALDFTNVENIWAYRAELSGDKVTLVRAKGVVNAGEGILLRSLTEDAQTANVPVTSESVTERNDFVGTVEAKHIDPTEGNNTNYVLAKVNGELCFSTIADGGITLRANSAYLPVPSSTAKSIKMVFGDDVTGINDIKTDAVKDNEVFYTLSGVRVLNPTKGLYIQNGKKVVIK